MSIRAARRRQHLGGALERTSSPPTPARRSAVRAGARQGLPPPDVLRHPGRGQEPVSASSASRRLGARAAGGALRYVLRLGDTELVLGQRLGEWVGHAPALEEDLGLANLALDLVGQARLLLTYAGELEGRGRDEDDLAFLRDAPEFMNLALAEQPNGDFGRDDRAAVAASMPGSCEVYSALRPPPTRAWRPSPPRRSRKRATTTASAAAGWCGSGTAPRRVIGACSVRSRSCGASPRSSSRPMRSMSGCTPPASPRRSPALAAPWSAQVDETLRRRRSRVRPWPAIPGTASAACTPSTSATCSPRCSTCSAPIPGCAGERGASTPAVRADAGERQRVLARCSPRCPTPRSRC